MQKQNKITIGVDGNEANLEHRVGVNTYAFETIKNIALLSDEWKHDMEFVIYLREKPLPHMPKSREGFSYQVLPGGGMWIIKTLMPHLYKTSKKPHVFWTPSHYTAPLAPMPRVVSIMDLGYLIFSEQFKKYDYWQLKLWTAWSLLVASRVIAISKTTEKDVVRRYPFTRKKIHATLLGYNKELFQNGFSEKDVRRVKSAYSIGTHQYILFMSMLKPSKNIEGLLRAWALVEKKYPETTLVIAGRKGWLFDSIFKTVEELHLTERVVFTGFVDEKDKPTLIAGARAFILPSFWEGFGLDVVSAMATGVPVIVSDRGSLPEVVADAGIIVNPDKADSIADGIKKVLSAPLSEYNRMSKKGKDRAGSFDWVKTARETISILRDAVHI